MKQNTLSYVWIRGWHLWGVIAVATGLVLGGGAVARAADFTIADGDVDGLMGLIEAINEANINGEPDTINLAPGGTYTLTQGDNTDVVLGGTGVPVIEGQFNISEITINGNGATIERSSAAGTPDFRIFLVDTLGDLTLNDVTVTGGSAVGLGGGGAGGNGGGILNLGKLELTNSIVSGNTATSGGGGIHSQSGGATVTLTNSTVSANTSSGCCGGISNAVSSTLTLINSTVGSNTADTNAGGVHNAVSSTLMLINSTVSGNTAGTSGNGCCGGILNAGTAMTLTNSTVSGNMTADNGGGIASTTTATLSNSTVTNNTANTGGGISIVAGTVNLKNTIVAGNTALLGALLGPDCFNPFFSPPLSATVASLGYNLIEDDSGCLFTSTTGDQIGDQLSPIDPLLGDLQGNGGPTEIHALLPASPAIDGGDPMGCTLTDQRGVPRPLDGDGDGAAACDIGAFEVLNTPIH